MPAPASVVATRHAVAAPLANHPGGVIAVAVSGGPDSVALAAAASWVAQRNAMRCAAIIVDHGLQPDSSRIAEWAAGVCHRLGLDPVVVERVTVGDSGGPEAAARDARYAALAAAADRLGASAVLLGHTLTDQAETVLLRLARGSGARSISSMRAENGRWVRPFLGLPRSLVHEAAEFALSSLQETAWADPHNDDPRFARSRLRALWPALVEALGPGLESGLARSADQARDDADALDAAAEAFIAPLVNAHEGIDVAALAALPRAVRTRAIRMLLVSAGATVDALDYSHVLAVDRLVTQWRGQGPVSIPGRLAVDRVCGRLRVLANQEGVDGR